MEPLLNKYYIASNPASFGGVRRLQTAVKKKKETVTQWLSGQDAYTLHKPIRRKFKRRQVIVGSIDQQWEGDLIDLSSLKECNAGHTFVLTLIDVLSKYGWAVPLKNKSGAEIVRAMEGIFADRMPEVLHTDKGKEFVNVRVQTYLKEKGIDFFVTENDDIKAAIVERFNRTIKERMWRYFTANNTLTYIDVLPDLVKSYNETVHSSIKEKPANVNKDNQEKIWHTLFGTQVYDVKKRNKFQVGDYVRISKTRRQFAKGYLPKWTMEIFCIDEVRNTTPVTYTLKDENGEGIKGTFYETELQKVTKPEVYRVEEIISTRKIPRKGLQYLVKWQGYPATFNSWIPAKNVIKGQ